GKTELAKSKDVSVWGTRLRPNMNLNYPPFTPDILVDTSDIDLKKYGIDGKIIPLQGGHTPGGLMVLIGNQLFIGDAFIGTFKLEGKSLTADGHHVREHFYHENIALASKELRVIQKIAKENNVATIYPTHFGPVSTVELSKYIEEEPTLKELSKIQAELLGSITQGNTDLAKYFLSKNFILNDFEGTQLTKTSFIENRILNPKTKIEQISAEDFRIIHTDNGTTIMTFIKKFKLAEKEPQNILVTV